MKKKCCKHVKEIENKYRTETQLLNRLLTVLLFLTESEIMLRKQVFDVSLQENAFFKSNKFFMYV